MKPACNIFRTKTMKFQILLHSLYTRSVSADKPVDAGFFICVHPRNPVFNQVPFIHEQPLFT